LSLKKLHPLTKIFFPNPYVLRIDYSGENGSFKEYGKLMRKTYKLIQGTWGYSQLEYETVQIKNDHGHTSAPGSSFFSGMSSTAVISSLLDPDYANRLSGYVCFKDEGDALQFRLSIEVKSVHVCMWPERKFLIHEMD